MEITLEKIELVKDRTGVTYAEAKQALEETDGSVVDAIIAIEEIINTGEKKKGFGKKGEALFSRLKEIVKKGNVSKIQVKKDGELVLNVPVNAGLVGVVIAPIAAVVAVVAAFGFKCSIEIIKTDGTIIDVSDAVTDAMGSVAEKSSTVAGEVKERSTTWYQKGLEKAGEAVSRIRKAGEEVADAAEELYEESRLDGEDEDETDAPCEAADTAEGAGETAEEQEETAEKE